MANLNQLVKDIESGERPTQDIDILQFFHKQGNGGYIPNMDKRIQVRDKDRDLNFIERVINQVNSTGDRSNLSNLTTVYFPKDSVTKLLNGNHTVEIELGLGITKAPASSVNFETELDGKMSKVIRLGNMLNKAEVERTSTAADDVKRELYQLMDERLAEGQDAKPSEDEIKDLLECYPFVNRAQVGQWISYHEQGGTRRGTLIQYNKQALKEQKQFYQKQRKYRDFVVLEPRTIERWDNTGVAQAFIQCKNENKTKVLIPFYCDSVAQSEKLEKGEDVKITNFYKELGEYYNLTFEVDFLAYN